MKDFEKAKIKKQKQKRSPRRFNIAGYNYLRWYEIPFVPFILLSDWRYKRMSGNCGVWFENGVYYIDHSFRVDTKREALEIGRKFNQISVFGWRTKKLAYCAS